MALIRKASADDLPRMVEMANALHRIVGEILPAHQAYLRSFFHFTMNHDAGLCLIAEQEGRAAGMIVASIAPIAISPVRVAHEHAWFTEPCVRGAGLGLLSQFEEWAAGQGCGAIRMSTPVGVNRAGRLLERRGYQAAETAWAKRL